MALALGIFGLPIPEETLMAFCGFLVSQGKLSYHLAIVVAFSGTTCGVTIGYFLGKFFGYAFLEKYAQYLRINHDRLHKAENWYKKFGKYALPFSYFIPGIRHFSSIFAGISQMAFPQFAIYAYGGGLVWTVTFVSLGFFLGENWRAVLSYSHKLIIPVIAIAVVLALGISAYVRYRKKP